MTLAQATSDPRRFRSVADIDRAVAVIGEHKRRIRVARWTEMRHLFVDPNATVRHTPGVIHELAKWNTFIAQLQAEEARRRGR